MQPLPQPQRLISKSQACAAALAIALAGSHATSARAQSHPPAVAGAVAFSIPAQPLGAALNELARQAHLQMTFANDLVTGRMAPALHGTYTPQQALQLLLRNSGLAASVSGAAVVVKAASPVSAPSAGAGAAATLAQQEPERQLATVHVTATAEQALRQAPGVSIITSEDISKRAPANDLSDIVRTMPGVNLTGNSPSGQYGNHRQIDLRGMGPENTLILIDGIPVTSRNATRMGRSGERNTRGDSNWVPAEAVERIEVLRGPAASRYGSGASGGVVNIITKQASDTFNGSVNLYANEPQSDDEQSTRRVGFRLAGPLTEELSYRLYGNVNKTDADSLDLNSPFSTGTTPPAGREGVRNHDANMQLRWAPHQQESVDLNLAWSRQGNIYAGDRAMNSAYEGLNTLAEAGAETNTKLRRSAALVHRKNWGERRSSRITLSYEGTDDTRLREGLSGGSEGAFLRDPANSLLAALQTSTSQLRNVWMNGEFSTPWHIAGLDQMLTLGVENRQERLDDPYAMSNANAALGMLSGRSSQASARTTAFFVESNIAATDKLLLTPGLRYDRHSQFGGNWSPSLNASQQLTTAVSLKAGIARAFKAPNLYQSNPNYLWETNGNGCPVNWPRPNGSGCSILGNPDLKPETSVNKEIGIAYDAEGMQAGLTYFHNDYRNKVVADMPDQTPVLLSSGRYLFRWTNAEKAVVRGLEGHWAMPVGAGRALRWSNNFTYMLDNRNRTTGQPLATVPRYTINSSLDWQVDERLSALFTATFYGRQKPLSRNLNGTAVTGDAAAERGSYALFGASVGYRLSAGTTARFGISNLFDKRLFREHNQAGAGANTYNEAGRAFYASLQATF